MTDRELFRKAAATSLAVSKELYHDNPVFLGLGDERRLQTWMRLDAEVLGAVWVAGRRAYPGDGAAIYIKGHLERAA
jgi:hypothetical protein